VEDAVSKKTQYPKRMFVLFDSDGYYTASDGMKFLVDDYGETTKIGIYELVDVVKRRKVLQEVD